MSALPLKAETNIPSACRFANIALKDAMILPYDANPGRMEFSEGPYYNTWRDEDGIPQVISSADQSG